MNARLKMLGVSVLVIVLAWKSWRSFHAVSPEPAAPPALAQQATPASAPAIASTPSTAMSAPVRARFVAERDDDPACIVTVAPAPTEVAASDDADSAPAAPAVATRAQAARAGVLARMLASADPYANAVAVWLDVDDTEERRAERVRRLAAMAASTRDPRVYALALRSCWNKTGRACESLSARRWSELDPGNALPWLMMLDEAKWRGDASGEQEATFHVTQSRQLAEREQAPLQPIIDAASDEPESLAAARALAIDAMGIVSAQAWPQSVMACRGATPADANAWQQCGGMIDLMEHRSDSLLARALGATLDKRLTGNARPLALLTAQRERLDALDVASSSNCADLRAKLALMRRLAVEGEAAVAVDLAR